MNRQGAYLVAAALVLSPIAFAAAAWGAKDDTILISREGASTGGEAGGESSLRPAVSSSGRYVAFASGSNDFSTADVDTVTNIFVRDVQNQTTRLVSRQSTSSGGLGATDHSDNPSISADGRYIAFESDADNLAGAADPDHKNVFVRDMVNGTTKLASRRSSSSGGAGADAPSGLPAISGNGRHVAFESEADNLAGAADPDETNVFVRDTVNGTTKLVSRESSSTGGEGAEDDSQFASVSNSGRYVAFDSRADNLSTADDDSRNVFVRDMQSSSTSLVSRQSASRGGAGGNDESLAPSISSDGRYVSFESIANNLSDGDDDGFRNIFVRDRTAQTTRLVSRRSSSEGSAGADASSFDSSISSDGRYVSFESDANNLSEIANPTFTNIFWRDTRENDTRLVSRQDEEDGGMPADGDCFDPSTSGNGRYVSFFAGAINLSPIDGVSTADVFRRQVLP